MVARPRPVCRHGHRALLHRAVGRLGHRKLQGAADPPHAAPSARLVYRRRSGAGADLVPPLDDRRSRFARSCGAANSSSGAQRGCQCRARRPFVDLQLRHGLFREVVYARIGALQRACAHAAVARQVAQVLADDMRLTMSGLVRRAAEHLERRRVQRPAPALRWPDIRPAPASTPAARCSRRRRAVRPYAGNRRVA